MKNFYLKSMGCKSNQFEGQIVAQKLIDEGYRQVYDINLAELYILNSCSVTHKSDDEAFYLLRNAKSKGLTTVLTGCVAQVEKNNLLDEPFIDFVIGNEDKFDLYNILKLNQKFVVTDLMSKHDFYKVTLENSNKTRVSLKIQDGCDNRCAYCIIPFARGKSRSADSEFIINEINRYADIGFKEVVLTGIHIGLWGKDFNKQLLDLLMDIEKNTKIQRFRLGSLNPLEITPRLLNFLERSEKFCPHFHLSLQSACNNTLKRMNRHYSVEFYLDLIDEINSRFNNPFLGSDIIAGFVGESEQDFAETVDNLKKSSLSQIHTFPYSIRKGTIAEKLDGHLDDKIKNERAAIIKQISLDKYQKFIENNIGTVQEILIEKRKDKKTGLFKGVTRNYLNVLLEEGDFNSLVSVKLSSYENGFFINN